MTTVSRWHNCAEGVQSLIDTALSALASPNTIARDSVLIRERPWRTVTEAAEGAILWPIGLTVTPVTNARDDEGHGVGVALYTKANQDTGADDKIHLWSQTAMGAVRNQRITAANVHLIEIEPRQMIDPAAFAKQFNVISFGVRCYVRSN
jgi:hypothetical protein